MIKRLLGDSKIVKYVKGGTNNVKGEDELFL